MLLKIFAILTAIVIIVYGVGAYFVVPEFEEVFSVFEADLPFSTKLVLASYPYWLVALIIPIGIYGAYLTKEEITAKLQKRILFIFASILLSSVVLLPLIVSALYSPIFQLEEASNETHNK